MQEHTDDVGQLGMTPRYLDSYCHEALYEIDVGVNEVCNRLVWDAAGLEGISHHN